MNLYISQKYFQRINVKLLKVVIRFYRVKSKIFVIIDTIIKCFQSLIQGLYILEMGEKLDWTFSNIM